MTGRNQGLQQVSTARSPRRFLQPLAVALVFLLVAVLFFSTAMMVLRRLEGLLLDGLKSKALYIAEIIEQSSKEKFELILRSENRLQSFHTAFAMDDEAFSLQETLAGALIDVARSIDSPESMGTAAATELKALADAARLRAIVLFDASGQASYQSHPLPSDFTAHVLGLLQGSDGIVIHLFHDMSDESRIGFVGIRRGALKGAVVLALDGKGIEYWARRVAIQASLEEQQLGKGVVYLVSEDADGGILASLGALPEETIRECLLTASAARASEDALGHCVRVGDRKLLDLAVPFHWNGSIRGAIHVGMESHEADRLLAENRRHIFLWAGLMGGVGLLAMGGLYQTQNRHVARLQAMRDRLYQAEKLSSLGKLGAGVAHEVRNPLNAISMATQRIQRDFPPADPNKKEAFDRITHILRDEIKRLNGIVEDFLALSRSSRTDFRPQSIADVLERILFLIRDEARSRGVRIETRWSDGLPMVSMDAAKMHQAILNIVRNALEAIPGDGRVTIVCEKAWRNRVSIRVSDTGVGIPAGEETRIWSPFYTNKEGGVGLGLAIAHEIITAHGGEIRIESEEGSGTIVEILLPGATSLAGTGSEKPGVG